MLVATGPKMGTLLDECSVMLFKYDWSNGSALPVSVPLVIACL